MITFQFILFIIISLISLLSLAGLGQVLISHYKRGFLESILFGFLVVALVVTSLHFFIKINFIFVSILIIIGVLLSIKNYIFLIKKLEQKKIIFVLIFLLLIPIYISQKYHEDLGYYHLPYLINLNFEKIIFGLANSNLAFVHNSIWLNIMSLFFNKYSYDFITVPTFLLYFIFAIFFIQENLNFKKKALSHYITIVSLFYLLLKFSRISEFGNDLPAVIFSILSIFYFFKFCETKNTNSKNYYFFCNFSFAVFSILIKFSSIPVFLLTIYLFFRHFKTLKKEIFKLNYFIVYFLAIIFFIQQFIYTGCFLFPTNFSCLEVSWFNNEFLELSKRLEIVNKSYVDAKAFFSKEEYLFNFNWFPFWLKRNYPEILENVLTMIFPIFLFAILSKSEKNKNLLIFTEIKIFALFFFVGFIFWLKFSPVYRFGVIYFLSLIFLITIPIYKNKGFSKKLFISLLFVFIFFNFTKNIIRISNEDQIFFGIKKIKNNYFEYLENQSDYISVYKPDTQKNKQNGWQGRLCWDIKFLCSYSPIDINKKNGYLFINKLNN